MSHATKETKNNGINPIPFISEHSTAFQSYNRPEPLYKYEPDTKPVEVCPCEVCEPVTDSQLSDQIRKDTEPTAKLKASILL